MRNKQVIILSADDSKTETGAAQDASQVVNASFQIFTGDTSAAGTVKIQMSNDAPPAARNIFTPTNWSDYPSATSSVASGVASPILITNLCASYIRAVYTSASGGTTTITVQMNTIAA